MRRLLRKPEPFPTQRAPADPFAFLVPVDILATRPLPSPAELLAEWPRTESQAGFVALARREIHEALFTDDNRFLLIVGPCSIHDLEAGREYARRLAELARKVSDQILVVMRVYFEKPRTTVG